MKCFEIQRYVFTVNSTVGLTVNMKCFEINIIKIVNYLGIELTVNMKCFEIINLCVF